MAALSFAYRPFFAQALLAALPAGADPSRLEAAQAQIFRFSLAGSLLYPVALVGVVAGLAYLYLAAFNPVRMPRLPSLIVAAAWAALLLALKDAARFGVLWIRGLDAIRGPADLRPGVGLGFLLDDGSSVLYYVLDACNAFDLGFVAVLALAIARSERVPFRLALGAAALPWLLVTGGGIGLGRLIPQ